MSPKKVLVGLTLLLALPLFVSAQGTTTVSTSPAAGSEQKAITLATVNIQHTNIVSEAGHSFVIAFDFTNREGIQTGVKYGVRLVAERPDKTQYIADSKMYDETIVLPEQSTTHREITYTAPSVLAGAYSVYLESNNGNGLSLAVAFVGKINLVAGKGLEILSSTCFLTVVGEQGSPHYSLTQGVDIASSETILLNCAAKNSASAPRSAAPVFETHYRTMYGKTVAQAGGDATPVLFAAGEQKLFSIALPKAATPQAYNVLVTLNTADGPSNTVDVHYVLRGASATIQALSLDKDYYQKGGAALLFLHWSGSADGFPRSRLGTASPSAATIEAVLTGRGGSSCAVPIQEAVGAVKRSYNTDIRIPVTATCLNPHVVVTLKDARGNILDQKELILTSPPNSQIPQTSPAPIFVALIFIAIVAGVMLIRKRRSGLGTLVMFLLVVAAGSVFPLDRAYADTYSLSTYLNWTINTSGTSFNPGASISISVHGLGDECGNSGGASLYVQIQGVTPEYLIAEGYGGDINGYQQVDVYGNITLTVPSTPGSYNLLFRSYDKQFGGVYYLTVPITVINPCAANQGASCSATSAQNACGGTSTNYGTIQCNGSCSVSAPAAPANPAGYGSSCSSAANSCGQTNGGSIQCNGSCSASTPANPSGYGSACTSSANSCGQTNSGSIQCNGSCSASTPANPSGYGSACSSAANSCGQTNSGNIQCNGSCNASTPANPAGYGSACSLTSAANACGQTTSANTGTYNCSNQCVGTPPAAPPNSNCPPDLTAGSTTASPSSGFTGQSESFSASVSDIGIGPASNFPNIFQIADNAITSTIAMLNAGTVASLSAGASTGISSSYTFASPGSYNVRACANFNTSWGGSVSESNANNNCGAWQALTIINPCTPVYTCSGTQTVLYTNAACQTSTYATCTTPTFCSSGSSACLYPQPSFTATTGLTGHLQVIPQLVTSGNTTQVHWNVDNVTSCTVTGTNGDSWTGLSAGTAGQTSSPIVAQTTYTLSCAAYPTVTPPTVTETATVNLSPIFQEL